MAKAKKDMGKVAGQYAALLAGLSDATFQNIARESTCPELLTLLARDERCFVRSTVARNTHTRIENLTLLARDEDPDTRSAVASNTNTRAEDLSLLAIDEDPNVIWAVAGNINAPVEALKILVKYEHWVIRDTALRTLEAQNSKAPAPAPAGP